MHSTILKLALLFVQVGQYLFYFADALFGNSRLFLQILMRAGHLGNAQCFRVQPRQLPLGGSGGGSNLGRHVFGGGYRGLEHILLNPRYGDRTKFCSHFCRCRHGRCDCPLRSRESLGFLTMVSLDW